MTMRKETARSWTVPDGHLPGWQNTDLFMSMYPTPTERRIFYARRARYYAHVRAGTAMRTREDLDRHMRGEVR